MVVTSMVPRDKSTRLVDYKMELSLDQHYCPLLDHMVMALVQLMAVKHFGCQFRMDMLNKTTLWNMFWTIKYFRWTIQTWWCVNINWHHTVWRLLRLLLLLLITIVGHKWLSIWRIGWLSLLIARTGSTIIKKWKFSFGIFTNIGCNRTATIMLSWTIFGVIMMTRTTIVRTISAVIIVWFTVFLVSSRCISTRSVIIIVTFWLLENNSKIGIQLIN